MVENSRKDPRAKVLSMTVRYKSATLDEFIEHHSHDVSRGGMYIKTPQPFPPGTLLKFEVKIGSDQKLMQGVGRVVWRRQSDEATESHPAGMGVKFIKLDEESKAMLGQLVSARSGETSAFDEVAPSSDLPPAGVSEPPLQVAPPAAGNFFPASDDDGIAPPAPEDRTVMKQAAELLQEALREVGTSTPDSAPPTAKRDSVSTKSAHDVATVPAPSSEANLPAIRGARAEAASRKAKFEDRPSSNAPSTVPPGRASAGTSVPGQASSLTAAAANKSRSSEPRTRSTQPNEGRSAAGSRAENSLRTSEKRDAQGKLIETRPAAAASAQEQFGQPVRKSGSGGGLRPVIMLLIVAGVAGLVFAISRKAAPPASVDSANSVSPPAAEPAPTPSPSVSAEEIASAAPSAQPSASGTAPAAESATPPAAESATPSAATSAAPTAAEAPAEPKAAPKQRARVKPVAAPPKKASGGSEVTTPEQPAAAPVETVAPKPAGPTETTPKTTNDTPPVTKPAPAQEDNPL